MRCIHLVRSTSLRRKGRTLPVKKSKTRSLALCGVLAALSVVLLLLGSALQIGTYAAPMLAAFLLLPVLEDYGRRYALTLYLCVSLLSLMLVPELELSLFYVLVVGYYPVLRAELGRIRRPALRWAVKFLVFNMAVAALYALLFLLVGPALLQELFGDGIGFALLLLAMGNFSFWLCDLALRQMTVLYRVRLRKLLNRMV